MKKWFALVLAAALLLGLFTACSQENQPNSSTAAPQTDDSTSQETGSQENGTEEKAVKVGIILNTSLDDGGWSQAHYESMLRTQAELGIKDEDLIILEQVPDTGADAANALENMIGEGCNVIFSTSSGFGDSVYTTAERYPDVYFHQFEGLTKPNVAAYSVRDWEAIFLCGYVAGKMSDTDNLGFMASQPQSSVVRTINAWAAGARYARPEATVQILWANSWYDPVIDKEGANTFFDSGVNCVGYHGSTASVMQAAAEKGGYATGFGMDMHDYAPTAVLTSFIFDWSPIYSEFITNVQNGTWTNDTLFPGMDKGCAVIAPFNAEIIPNDILADCEAVAAKMGAGEIEVFGAPVVDNNGNTVLEEGQEFTQDELIGMMFLLDNLIGSLPG